jgi:inner membrane protein
MDFFSHAVLPYLLGSFLGLKRKHLAALVLGGIAPDLDVLVVWINYIYPTSLLIVHRGFTHTLFFGFFVAAFVLFLATRDGVLTWAQRYIKLDLDFSVSCLAFAYAGVLSHLSLDYLTTKGVPLFYPFTAARYSADIFYMIELIIMIASLLVLIKLFRERSRAKFNKNLFIIFVAFLLIVGGIRIEGKEMAQGYTDKSAEVYPDTNLFQWAVLDNDSDRFQVREFNALYGEMPRNSTFLRLNISSGSVGSVESVESIESVESERALDLAENLPQVKLFRWRAYAVAINASERNGSWLLEYYDPVVKLETMNSWRTAIAASGYGSLRVKVEDNEARLV